MEQKTIQVLNVTYTGERTEKAFTEEEVANAFSNHPKRKVPGTDLIERFCPRFKTPRRNKLLKHITSISWKGVFQIVEKMSKWYFCIRDVPNYSRIPVPTDRLYHYPWERRWKN